MEIEKVIEVDCVCPTCKTKFKKKVFTVIDIDTGDLAPPNYFYP